MLGTEIFQITDFDLLVPMGRFVFTKKLCIIQKEQHRPTDECQTKNRYQILTFVCLKHVWHMDDRDLFVCEQIKYTKLREIFNSVESIRQDVSHMVAYVFHALN